MNNLIKLKEILIKHNYKISTAESCTGGLLASTLVSLENASMYFEQGFITYSNESKVKYLNVNKELIDKYGAVSEQVARDMVFNLRRDTKADICVSVTGLAGPSGGSIDKPIGLVYIGFYINNDIFVEKKIFDFSSRTEIRTNTVEFIIDYLYNYLIKQNN